MPAQTSIKCEMNTVQYHPLCLNIVTAVLLLYILWTGFYPPRLMPINVLKVYCTRYNIVCCVSKHSYYYCSVDPFTPSRLLSVPDSSLFTGMIMEKETPCMSAAWKTILKQVC